MATLNFRLKLFLVSISVIIPLIFLTYNLVSEYHGVYRVADDEAKGIDIGRVLLDIVAKIQAHRGLENQTHPQKINDDVSQKLAAEVSKSVLQLDQRLKESGFSELDDSWNTLRQQLLQWSQSADSKNTSKGNIGTGAAKDKTGITNRMERHSQLIHRTDEFLNLSSEASGLVLDPEASSYFLIILTIQKIPDWIEQLAQLQDLGKILLADGDLSEVDKTALVSRAHVLQLLSDNIDDGNESLKRIHEPSPTTMTAALADSKKFTDFLTSPTFDTNNIATELLSQFNRLANTSIRSAAALQTESLQRLARQLAQRKKTAQTKLLITYVSVLLTLCLTSYLAYGFYRTFSNDMQVVNRSVTSVAAGDLTTIVTLNGRDELADIGQTLENMNARLSALVANVRSNASMVSNLGQNLSTGINDLSFRTEQQSASLEQTSSSVKELAETVKDNAESARKVSNMASNVRLIAESSGETMKSAVASMKDIQTSALKVQDIVNMIDRISFQTDILALNAAVEASHAGEHGLGFAVVATEVRALAQRSADAARQIRHLIDESVTKVENGVYQIDEASITLNEILGGIRNLATNINAISEASNEQSNALALISEAILSLEGITQSNSRMAEDAKLVSGDLEQRAITLTSAVSSFKLRQGTADEAYAMVKQAANLYAVSGDASLARITDDVEMRFADRDMYVFAIDQQGYYKAFAGRPEKLGVNVSDVPGVMDGQKLVQDAFAVPEAGGWIDYQIINLSTQKIDKKTSYMVRSTENLVIGCGVYKLV
jgi:methyl-accepting chemotaxis protein